MGLSIGRRPGERILIGDNIEVTVVSIRGNQVRIDVDAPKEIRVDREELRKRIEASKDL